MGWFDSVVIRRSRRVSGITNLSLNSIDVLSSLDTVKICVAYDVMVNVLITILLVLSSRNVVAYEVGWSEDLESVIWKTFLKCT